MHLLRTLLLAGSVLITFGAVAHNYNSGYNSGGTDAAASCPSDIDTWNGTSAKTIGPTIGLLYTTGATPVAAARVLTLPTVASYTLGCSLRVIDLAGIFNATNAVTPTRASTDTIDGATTGLTLTVANQAVVYTPTVAGKWATEVPPSLGAQAATANNFITGLGADGLFTKAQPAFSNLSGAATATQLPATPLATGTSVALTAPRQYYVCTGTCTVTPPVPAAGNEFCVMNGNNVATVITMAAIGSSARYETTARTGYGTAGTGTFISGGAAADKVCLLGLDSTHYLTVSYNGTWTAN